MRTFPLTSLLVQPYQKETFMRAGIVLKRRFFDGKYLMSSENPCLSLSCRNWFRRHWHTSQWTGFHQLRKCPHLLPVQGLACFLIYRSHRWKPQAGLFSSTRLTGSVGTAQTCVGLASVSFCLSKCTSWHWSGGGGSDTCILLRWLICPCNLEFLSCCFLDISNFSLVKKVC